MTRSDYIGLLNAAMASVCGLVLAATDNSDALRIQRCLYRAREHARKAGSTQFDQLSFLLRPGCEVWILRREAAEALQRDDYVGCAVRNLSRDELPPRPHVRGRGKPRRPRIPLLFI